MHRNKSEDVDGKVPSIRWQDLSLVQFRRAFRGRQTWFSLRGVRMRFLRITIRWEVKP